MRNAISFVIGFALVVLALGLTGCANTRPASQAYTVDANGVVSAATRSASDGSTAPGRQEFIGVYIPLAFGFDFKAAVSGDPSGFPIIIGQPPAAPSVVPAAARATGCTVEQSYTVEECYTEMVPVQKTRQVQRTRSVPAVSLPVPPQAAPAAAPCACSGGSCDVPMGFLAASK